MLTRKDLFPIRFSLGSLVFFAIFLFTFSDFSPGQKILAEDLNGEKINQLSARAEAAYSANQYRKAINLWLKILKQQPRSLPPQKLALVQANIASTLFQIGKYGAAIRHWHKALAIYRDLETDEPLAVNLTNQARAYLALGQIFLAQKRASEAIAISKPKKLTPILTEAYLILGTIYQNTGNYTEASANFSTAINYASTPSTKIVANHNLSQVFHSHSQLLLSKAQDLAAEGRDSQKIKREAGAMANLAWSTAQKAVALSEKENIQSFPAVDALFQLIKLSLELERAELERDYYKHKAETILSVLPASTRKVYALINLSKFQDNPVATLMKAVEIAEAIEDDRSASIGLGYLGVYYEQIQQYQTAHQWTQKARQAARLSQNNQNLYKWDWQAGRIYHALGQTKEAIIAYEQAIASLTKIRSQLAIGQERQSDFVREIEPVYRELLHLLLSNNPTTEQLEQALKIRDLLQLSELENFFGDYCFELLPQNHNQSLEEQKTGLIYTIILPEATYLLFKGGRKIKSFRIDIAQSQLEQMVKQWRFDLENRTEDAYLFSGRQMYELLLQPLESELALVQPSTLIFIPDGLLRNIPMAALYDGQKFLVENYALGTSLGLNLSLKKTELLLSKAQALAFGLSVETLEFNSLPYVREEIKLLAQLVETRQIFNEEFTKKNMTAELNQDNFPLVHIATHGQFNGTLEDSFLLTYQEKISLSELETILDHHQNNFPNNPIELLTLSACQTATGNKRATLGLAGVAIRSGVEKVLGSLWFVNDSAENELIADFYNSLFIQKMSSYEALQQAQVKMLNEPTSHPALWSSLILIAN